MRGIDFVKKFGVRWSFTGAAADLDYIRNRYFPRASLLTVTRSGSAWIMNQDGTVSSIGANLPRRSDRGLWVEKQQLNSFPVMTGSTMFTTDSSLTRSTSLALGPDGQSGMNGLASANGAKTQRNLTIGNDSNTHLFSMMYPKATDVSVVRRSSVDAICFLGTTVDPLQTTIIRFDGSVMRSAALANQIVEDCGGWWRVSIKSTNNSTGNTLLVCQCFPDLASGLNCDAFMPQALLNDTEIGSPIAAATTTRNADVITTALPSIGMPSTGPSTLYVEWDRRSTKPPASTRRYLGALSDGSANNRISIFMDENGFINGEVVAGGVQQALITGAQNLIHGGKAALAWATNDVQLYVNGVSIGTDTSATLPTGLTTWHHGQDHAGANQFGGPIRREAVFPARIAA